MNTSIPTQALVNFLLDQAVPPSQLCLDAAVHYRNQAIHTDISTDNGRKQYDRWKQMELACLKAHDLLKETNI